MIRLASCLLLAPISGYAQLSTSDAAKQLTAKDWQQRAEAFATIDRDPKNWKDPTMARLLMRSVLLEDELQKETYRSSHGQIGVSDRFGEGYSEYAAQALDECLRFCDKSRILAMILADARAEPTKRSAVELLGNTYSGFGFSVSQRVQIDSILIAASVDSSSYLTRASALSALGEAIRTGTDLPTAERQRLHQAVVVAATTDRNAEVRAGAVRRIAYFSDPADQALLMRIATEDPAQDSSRGAISYPVRDAARRAMDDIARARRP